MIDLSRSHVRYASTAMAGCDRDDVSGVGQDGEIVGMNESSQRMRGWLPGGLE